MAKSRMGVEGKSKGSRAPKHDTADKFGGFIHSYTMREAVDDHAVVPLVYEGRMAVLQQNQAAMDAWFERLTQGLSDRQKADLKRKLARAEVIQDARERLKIIAFDIVQHFEKNFHGRGLKGQVAANKRASAIRLRQFMQEFGSLRVEVIMSRPDLRDTDEDTEAIDDEDRLEDRKLIDAFWQQMMNTDGEPSVKLDRGQIIVTTPESPTPKVVRPLVEDWLRTRAKRIITERLTACHAEAARHGIPMPELWIRPMAARWGSCTPAGRVILNIELIKAPTECIDYVITHELCHLIEPNHNARFWQLLMTIMPNWDERRGKLNKMADI